MKKNDNSRIVKRLFGIIKEKKFILALALLLAFVSVLLSLYVNVVIGNAVDLMVGKDKVDFAGVGKCAAIIGVCVGISALFNYFMNVILSKVSYYVVKKMRTMLFRKLQKISVAEIESRKPGDIISRVINDIEKISDGLILSFGQLFSGIVTIIGTIVFMMMLNVKMALIVIVATPITLLVARFIANNTYKYFLCENEKNGELSGLSEESISGIPVIHAFSKEKDNLAAFCKKNSELCDASIKAVFFSSMVNPTTRLINGLIYAIVGILGAFTVIKNPTGAFTIGVMSSFLAYANQFSKPFNEISEVLAEFQGAIAGAARVFEIIDKPDEEELPNALESFDSTGKIEFQNVDFSYTPDKELIQNLNLDIQKSTRVAICGPTGCGKTTVINLLMRFYEPNSGKILFDDIENNELTRSAIHQNFGMVLQETWLRHGTIRENIAMCKKDATQEEIEEAAKRASCHSFIMRLEKGYDTIISNEGELLSYGERQLICIARLMLLRPPMLILDEATSSIDTRTEIKIQNAFADLMQGRTTFIVAHRLSTIRNCDIILVMKDGKILEQGTHEELIENNGFYKELYDSQK